MREKKKMQMTVGNNSSFKPFHHSAANIDVPFNNQIEHNEPPIGETLIQWTIQRPN